MADRLNITRRDFLNGIALSLAAGTSLSPVEILARESKRSPYPPALTGLRGSHAGSFEIAHAAALSGARYGPVQELTDSTYDLVVVGGGVSGLSAAYFYLARAGTDRRVLVLDNHDDFGGHARRNEFEVGGETLIGYGGSQSIDTPSAWSKVSAQLLVDLGIDVSRFYDWFDRDYFTRRGSGPGIFFSADRYGRDATLPNVLGDHRSAADPLAIEESLPRYPLDLESKLALRRLLTTDKDYLAGRDNGEKLKVLRTTSYSDFLRRHAGMPEPVVALLRDTVKGLWGVGWDALSALEAYRWDMPGTAALGVETGEVWHEEPYIFHFPDGNATLARALVRALVPRSTDAADIEALVTARVDYATLDRPGQACRIRLDSTAVDVRHTGDEQHVDVTYIQAGRPARVRARHCVLACYNAMIPHICPEIPEEQAEAIGYAVKVPLVYLSIAVRNWKPWADLGFHSLYAPQASYMHSFGLDFPVSVGGYRFTRGPDTPTVLHGTFAPTQPDVGLTDKQQSVAGRRRLYEMSYDDHEQAILAQLDGALGAAGFDAERDLAAITVNRWPHGYAYEYNELYEPPDYSPASGPHVTGRAQLGRISIANSDSSAYAYLNGAIDAADRAVAEQLASGG